MLFRVDVAGSGESPRQDRNFSRAIHEIWSTPAQFIPGTLFENKMPPPSKRRKLDSTAVEEVLFDPAARQDYLTGFHKRKLQRAKHAQEVAEKKARAARIEERRKVCLLPEIDASLADFSSAARREKA
jgi:Nucleolar protein 12 (25kDa)